MAKEIYCQNETCGREITSMGGVVVDRKAYCSFEHGSVENKKELYHKSRELQKLVRKGQLTQYGSLENSASE